MAYILSANIECDDARSFGYETIEIPISKDEYDFIKAIKRADYYTVPEEVQQRLDEKFFKWNRRHKGGYSLGAVRCWEE